MAAQRSYNPSHRSDQRPYRAPYMAPTLLQVLRLRIPAQIDQWLLIVTCCRGARFTRKTS